MHYIENKEVTDSTTRKKRKKLGKRGFEVRDKYVTLFVRFMAKARSL